MKREITLNNELTLSWPSGFHQMTDEEMKEAYRGDDSMHWGFWDKERHTVIMVLCKKYNPLAIKLTSQKKMVIKNEKMTRAMCSKNAYKFEFFFTHQLAGSIVGGFCYTYSVGEIRQAAKCVLVQRKNYIYNIACYGRAENSPTDHELFDKVLDSVSFS